MKRYGLVLFVFILCGFSNLRAQQQVVKFGFEGILEVFFDSTLNKLDSVMYDNFNSYDVNAAVVIKVLVQNNDTLLDKVEADIQDAPGTALRGSHYTFAPQKVTFNPGTNVHDGSFRKSIKITLIGDNVYYGNRYFDLILNNFVGVQPPQGLINGEDHMRIYIDYDGNAGIPTLSFHDYTLYPMPAKDKLFIDGVKTTSFGIYDLSGRLLIKAENTDNVVDVSSLSEGLYVLKAISDKGLIIQKFIKQ